MPKLGVQPDALIYDLLLNIFGKMGNGTRCMKLFSDIYDNKFLPNESNFVAILECFGRIGDVEHAIQILKHLKEHPVIPIKKAAPKNPKVPSKQKGFIIYETKREISKTAAEKQLKWFFEQFMKHLKSESSVKLAQKMFGDMSRDYIRYFKKIKQTDGGEFTTERIKKLKNTAVQEKNELLAGGLIEFLCHEERREEAIELMYSFLASDLKLGAETTNIILREYVKRKELQRAVSLQRELERRGARVDLDTSNLYVRYIKGQSLRKHRSLDYKPSWLK
jgi:pentatricopeptide repeat protein